MTERAQETREVAAPVDVVFAASYHAALNYIKYRGRSQNDFLLLDPNLSLFGEFCSTFASCRLVPETWSPRECRALLGTLNLRSVEFWSYSLSEPALFVAKFARDRGIPTRFVLPTEFADALHASSDFDWAVLRKWKRSLLRLGARRLLGYPVSIKTYNSYFYYCVDTAFAESVTTSRELKRAGAARPDGRFADFIEFVRSKYADVLAALCAHAKPCIMLDEDLGFLQRSMGVTPENAKSVIGELLARLEARNFTVSLKPTYYGEPCLSSLFRFAAVIPGEIPLEALDIIMPPGTVVTGFTSSFLNSTETRNLKPVAIPQLSEQLAH